MEDLIKALQILKNYATDTKWPTGCEHDTFYVTCVNPEDISPADEADLEKLGFFIRDDDGSFLDRPMSYRYGSS